MPEPFLTLHGVEKSFGATKALAGIDLTLAQDELLVVLGPTGSGKTTLLRCIAGLEEPNRGSIRMAGTDLAPVSPAARDIALVFQNFSLYPHWTVRKNMEFPLRAPGRNVDEATIASKVAWAADLLRIKPLLDRPAARLSGGEMQRVAIGRAIVRRPKLFLMDEPLTNLDAKLRESLRVELVAIRRELGAPMIFVTHDQAEALSMGDRVVVLGRGKVLQTGVPEAIYTEPASPDVAVQLGHPRINLLTLTRRDDVYVTESGIELFSAKPDGRARVIVGIRPEDVLLSGGEQEARVELVEDTGPMKIAVVVWGRERLRALVDKHATEKPGDVVYPSFRQEKLHVWDSD